ncbi:FliH/SctL family protein [Legionella quateirensis]|uniref:Flagellar assembly protein FliH n=1 Tax=Legionella quateirensis TaxID=45072 RepID=A0A378KSY6_9GAMM|nr:FliH/SctL family protein [Legionella quateirensis]KTD51317.1 polar flagellar assembly protein FliH [Legionella quateirensis]STY17436.1 flagellar assembly protein FliH [Legionella quateirensis]
MAKLIQQALISHETVTIGAKPVTTSDEIDQKTEMPLQINETDLEELRTQAFQQGFIAGQKEGMLLAEQQMAQSKQDLETLLSAIPQAIEQNRLHLHDEIADIILLITQEYFIEQQQKPEALHQQINQILRQLNSKQSIELHVHPDEIKTLHQANIKLETAHLNGLLIKADPGLAPGGCLIKTEHGVFDASLETRLERLKEILIHMKHGRQHALLD